MNRKIIVPSTLEEFKGNFLELLKHKFKQDRMFAKLREIVKEQKTFEEESLQYKYKGKDKDTIWSCMEFFYQNLWNKNFREFIWTNSADEWENYNIQLKYKDKYSIVEIVYGIGSFCVIKPLEQINDKYKVLDLEKIVIKTNTEVIYYE